MAHIYLRDLKQSTKEDMERWIKETGNDAQKKALDDDEADIAIGEYFDKVCEVEIIS